MVFLRKYPALPKINQQLHHKFCPRAYREYLSVYRLNYSHDMRTITAGVFRSTAGAEAAINELRSTGIPDTSISYIYENHSGKLETHTADEAVTEAGTDIAKGMGGGAASGAVTGGAVGALAGLVVATGVLPGLGALFIGGPLAAALGLTGAGAAVASGAATGAIAGGLLGALTGLGISEPDAHLYEDRVREGDVLLVVESKETGVNEILARNGAEEVREYSTNI